MQPLTYACASALTFICVDFNKFSTIVAYLKAHGERKRGVPGNRNCYLLNMFANSETNFNSLYFDLNHLNICKVNYFFDFMNLLCIVYIQYIQFKTHLIKLLLSKPYTRLARP